MKETQLDYYFEDMDACPCPDAFVDIQHPWEALAKKDMRFGNERESTVDPTVKITGDVSIGKHCTIDPYVVIEGPVKIGDNCTIRPFALLRPGTVLGNDVVVGHATEVKNVIAFNEVKMASHTFVGDSILGKGARVASGTIVGNRRFDQKVIKIKINDQVFDTGKDKFGCILGDFARVGACVTTAPGVVVGKYTWTYANMSLRGFYPAESMVKLRQQTEIVDKERQVLSSVDKEGHV